MNYRNAIASDLPELERLFTESCQDPETANQRRKHLLHAQLVLVAQFGSDIVGFVTLRNNQVDLLYVHRNLMQQGIAEELLSKLGYIAKILNTSNKAADGIKTVRPFFVAHHSEKFP
jgi:hypothetical protein